jgi:outer membrane protein
MTTSIRLKFLAGLIAAAFSAPALADDLLSVYRDALAADPVYSAARAGYEASKEKVVQGRALLLPNVNATAGANYTWFNSMSVSGSTSVPLGTNDWASYNAGVNVTQPLYRPQNSVTYAQSGIQASQAQTS